MITTTGRAASTWFLETKMGTREKVTGLVLSLAVSFPFLILFPMFAFEHQEIRVGVEREGGRTRLHYRTSRLAGLVPVASGTVPDVKRVLSRKKSLLDVALPELDVIAEDHAGREHRLPYPEKSRDFAYDAAYRINEMVTGRATETTVVFNGLSLAVVLGPVALGVALTVGMMGLRAFRRYRLEVDSGAGTARFISTYFGVPVTRQSALESVRRVEPFEGGGGKRFLRIDFANAASWQVPVSAARDTFAEFAAGVAQEMGRGSA